MAFFAVAGLTGEDFEIAGCHLNFWSLPYAFVSKDFWRAPFANNQFCDVGLRLKAKDPGFTAIQIALPFNTQADGFTDLSHLVFDRRVAQLIFGQEVANLAGNRIKYSGSSVHETNIEEEVLSVSNGGARYVEDQSGKTFSLWELNFHRRINIGEAVYLRVRFTVKHAGDAWTSRGWGFAKRGVLVDFRICDVRESSEVPSWETLRERIKPLAKINFFLIASAEFFARGYSPRIHYMRLLEHSVWNHYICAHRESRSHEKLTIFQWRAPLTGTGSSDVSPDAYIGVDKPFRLFADLHKDFGWGVLSPYLIGLATGAILTAVVNWASKWLLGS